MRTADRVAVRAALPPVTTKLRARSRERRRGSDCWSIGPGAVRVGGGCIDDGGRCTLRRSFVSRATNEDDVAGTGS
jgi:hypothetical protein